MSFYLVGHRETKIHVHWTLPASEDHCPIDESVNGFSFTCRHLELSLLNVSNTNRATIKGRHPHTVTLLPAIQGPSKRARGKKHLEKHYRYDMKYGAERESNPRSGLHPHLQFLWKIKWINFLTYDLAGYLEISKISEKWKWSIRQNWLPDLFPQLFFIDKAFLLTMWSGILPVGVLLSDWRWQQYFPVAQGHYSQVEMNIHIILGVFILFFKRNTQSQNT